MAGNYPAGVSDADFEDSETSEIDPLLTCAYGHEYPESYYDEAGGCPGCVSRAEEREQVRRYRSHRILRSYAEERTVEILLRVGSLTGDELAKLRGVLPKSQQPITAALLARRILVVDRDFTTGPGARPRTVTVGPGYWLAVKVPR